ncbi:class I SAM-dependent methyltransferase [Holophaga foetida]|uniref:class I SAM-dependent methyltransferase n=1 Tax=Holophaga foetida TaxID=35839 RepID=UPI0002473F3C|nr:class I SAM-dependent methyltransferase [Holophaga foetida]
MNSQNILERNDAAIEKWNNPPKLSPQMNWVDRLKLWHDTKRFFFVRELERLQADMDKSSLNVLDFGSGHGGVTIDVATVMGSRIRMHGYDVSPKAVEIAHRAAECHQASVSFIADPSCDMEAVLREIPLDAIISCDVFGHVPSVPETFRTLRKLLPPGGRLIAFSETVTGQALTIPTYLARKGFRMDDSEEEHISLHSVHELKEFLEQSGFVKVRLYPYDPIRFPFYPKRYTAKLRQINKPLYLLASVLTIFQNRLTEVIFNQINLWLAKRVKLHDTAGCLLVAEVPQSGR